MKVCPVVLSLLYPRAHSQPTFSRPAHDVLSIWAWGEKTEFIGMFLLAQARARDSNCVQHIVSCEYAGVRTDSAFPLLVLQPKTTMAGTRNRKSKRLEPHFQTPATRSAEDVESAVALALTGVHQGAHVCPAKKLARWERSELLAVEQQNKYPQEKERTQTWFQCLCFMGFWQYQLFLLAGQHIWHLDPSNFVDGVTLIPGKKILTMYCMWKPSCVWGDSLLYAVICDEQ